MTTTPKVKVQEIFSSGFVESASLNSISDFTPSKCNDHEMIFKKENNDFINTFVCHLIFYAVFCISLVLFILIDLDLGSFVKKVIIYLIKFLRNNIVEKDPAFA